MTPTQRDDLMKSMYVETFDKNIFNVLACLHAEIPEQKIELQNEKFSFKFQ
jgi:hypothetical protein